MPPPFTSTTRPPPSSPLFPYTTLFRSPWVVPHNWFEKDLYPGHHAVEIAPLSLAFHTHNAQSRSEEHTSELQSRRDLVCRLLLEKKKPQRRPPARQGSR